MGHEVGIFVQLLGALIVDFSKIEPNGRGLRHNIGLVATVYDDIVGPL